MRKNTITFRNGNHAVVVTAPRDARVKAILDALEIASLALRFCFLAVGEISIGRSPRTAFREGLEALGLKHINPVHVQQMDSVDHIGET